MGEALAGAMAASGNDSDRAQGGPRPVTALRAPLCGSAAARKQATFGRLDGWLGARRIGPPVECPFPRAVRLASIVERDDAVTIFRKAHEARAGLDHSGTI